MQAAFGDCGKSNRVLSHASGAGYPGLRLIPLNRHEHCHHSLSEVPYGSPPHGGWRTSRFPPARAGLLSHASGAGYPGLRLIPLNRHEHCHHSLSEVPYGSPPHGGWRTSRFPPARAGLLSHASGAGYPGLRLIPLNRHEHCHHSLSEVPYGSPPHGGWRTSRFPPARAGLLSHASGAGYPGLRLIPLNRHEHCHHSLSEVPYGSPPHGGWRTSRFPPARAGLLSHASGAGYPGLRLIPLNRHEHCHHSLSEVPYGSPPHRGWRTSRFPPPRAGLRGKVGVLPTVGRRVFEPHQPNLARSLPWTKRIDPRVRHPIV